MGGFEIDAGVVGVNAAQIESAGRRLRGVLDAPAPPADLLALGPVGVLVMEAFRAHADRLLARGRELADALEDCGRRTGVQVAAMVTADDGAAAGVQAAETGGEGGRR